MRVEVLLATHNGGKYIARFLDSLANQVDVEIDLIVSDDNSSDETIQIATSYTKYFRTLTVLNGPNKGAKDNFAHLIKISNSNFSAFADQDDIWLPNHLRESLNRLLSHTGKPALVFSKVEEFSDSGQSRVWPNINVNPSLSILMTENMARGCTTVLNRELMNLLKQSNFSKVYMHDWWAILVAKTCGVVEFINAPGVMYRVHEENVVGTRKPIGKRVILFCRNYFLQSEWHPQTQASQLLGQFGSYLTNQDRNLMLTFANLKKQSFKGRFKFLFQENLVLRQSGLENRLLKLLLLLVPRFRSNLMHTRLKLRVRDKLIKFPRTYRLLRATYHGVRTFYSIYSAPIAQYKVQSKSQTPVKKILALALPMKSEPKLSVVDREVRRSTTTLDVIIPVFNRGDLAAGLISELQKQIESISELIKVNLLCADDCSDTATATKLKDLCESFGFTYIKREKNLGFVGNVNAAWEIGDSEFVLLINSDVTITDGFLERLLDPMTHDPKVGLSTNPTFGMIAGHLESGSNLNSLNSYFLGTSATQVSFLDACTAVGYSLVIRRSAINGATLLDPEYGRGYGEDSDLHYRVIGNGYRSVWNLDHAVSHVGSASFNMIDSAPNDRALGRKRFLRKWGLRYFAEIDSHTLALDEAIRRRVAGFPPIDVVSTWVVLPTVLGNIGGIQVGCDLAIEKSKQDFRTKIVTLDGSEGSVIGDFISVGNGSDLFGKETSGTVILVGAQSLELLMDEKWVNPALKFVYFAQGPDWLIDPSTLDIYRESIPRVSEVISVSEYMDIEIMKFSEKVKVNRHTPSTNYARFAGLSNQTKDTDFILIHREESGKLGWLTIMLANFLSSTNFVTVVSNNRPYGLSKDVNLVTGLDRNSMLKFFAQATVFIDTSIFEGFGLTPREAAMQNSRVLFMDVTDGRTELKRYPSHFSTFSFSPSVFEMAELAKKALTEPSCSGCNFCDN